MLGYAKYVRYKVKILYAGKELVKVRIIRNVGYVPFAGHRLFLYGLAVYIYFPIVKTQYAAASLERCRFARAVVAYKAIYLPRRYVQRKRVYSLVLTIHFSKIFYAKHILPPFYQIS